MGNKKKNAGKQQDRGKGVQANGSHDKHSRGRGDDAKKSATHANSSPMTRGGGDRQGKPPTSSRPPSSSSSSSASLPESRLPWRLMLLVSLLAGGVAIVCVNEPAKSVIEDVYLRHAQPHVLWASQAVTDALAALQGDAAPGSPPSREGPPSPQTLRSSQSKPPGSPPSGDRAKRDTPQSTPPPSTTTTTTTPPPPPPPPDTKSEKTSQGKPDTKPAAAPEKQTVQPENGQEKKTTRPEELRKTEREAEEKKKKADCRSREDEESVKKEREEKAADAMTREKTLPADVPTPDPDVKPETPTPPVVEEIKARTTPRPGKDRPDDKKPSSTEEKTQSEKPAEKDDKVGKQAEKPTGVAQQKPEGKAPEKPPPQAAGKPAGREEKPGEKPAEKPVNPKAPETSDRKASEPSEPKQKKAHREENSATADGKPDVVTQKSPDAAAKSSAERVAVSGYAKANITNAYDFKIRDKLDKAEELLEQGKLDEALSSFEQLLSKHPKSPRAQMGRADSLDKLAFQKRSNEVLEQCILGYERVIYHGQDAPPELVKAAGHSLVKKQQFRGWGTKAAKTLAYLVERFPKDLSLQRELGVSHLMVAQNGEAREVFEKLLEADPDDGFSLVHLGFIVKTSGQDPEAAIPLLTRGIDSGHPGTQDGRFYFQLGDAYQRLGRDPEARAVYQRGADKGLFLSADQRSLYNVRHLTSRPWWTKEQTGYQEFFKLLEDNWKIIRNEAVKQLDADAGMFKPEAESLREKGNWKQLTMYQQGRQNNKVCALVPKTCELIEKIPDAKSCKRGQVKFSLIHPGTHVWPHCGPTNCRLRAHLGLVVPKGPRIRVVNETRTWEEGKFLIFDDSFEHEVWHDGDSLRLVLIVDFWHPDLTAEERGTLVPI